MPCRPPEPFRPLRATEPTGRGFSVIDVQSDTGNPRPFVEGWRDKPLFIVYFSSATGNTHKFVAKLGIRSARIPTHKSDPELLVDEPYVLIVPTYGGGASITGDKVRPVPPQVIRFLNNEHNRSLIRGVISAGNANFGIDFGLAGEIVAEKCAVPYVYRFELMGNDEDVAVVRSGLADFFGGLPAAS